MSNNEVFELIFEDISNKIINEYLKTVNVTKEEHLYKYTTNISVKSVINSLNQNFDTISDYLIKNLFIEDGESLKKILYEHINSDYFKNSISKIEASIETSRKLDIKEIKKSYIKHLRFNLMSRDVREKVFALTKDHTFLQWVTRRWKIVGSGYLLVLVILIISYYVFISN